MISRKAVEDCKINGYTIPAQSLLFVNIWAIGRDPKELPVTLAALIQCFDWKLPNVDGGVDMSERAGLTAPRAHDLKCVPLARFTPTL
ncbi:hypothetical protein Gotri_001123, partial [Gossypium trilobum]|nr:hypothetical protein [Gossypium trilobum]